MSDFWVSLVCTTQLKYNCQVAKWWLVGILTLCRYNKVINREVAGSEMYLFRVKRVS